MSARTLFYSTDIADSIRPVNKYREPVEECFFVKAENYFHKDSSKTECDII